MIAPEAIRLQVARILATGTFVRSRRMGRLLRFVVERALEGRGGELKEYLLAVEVFDKEASFDPRIDPLVRVEARRLRSKLRKYYETEGPRDPVRIDLPTGGYVPVFGPAEKAPAPPDKRSIAVLPFANRSAEAGAEYFSDGLTEELIRALTKVEGLRVVAPGSAFQFRGPGHDLRQIGRQLGVGAVLQGAVRTAAARLRVSAQLVQVSDGSYLWAETYERPLADVFAIQDEISRAIVDTLRIRLASDRRRPLVRRYSDNLPAYNLYLKGRHQAGRRTREGLENGIGFFQQALKLDPQHAPACAGLADCYALLCDYGMHPASQMWPRAREAALRALELDDGLAEAETSLAYVHCVFEWQWASALLGFQRALELNPGYAETHHWYGYNCLTPLGRLDEALAHLERAQQLDPLSLIIGTSLAGILLMRREYDQAAEQCRKTLHLDAGFYKAYTGLGRAHFESGRYLEAVRCFEKAWDLSGGALYIRGSLGRSYAMAGQKGKARRLLTELRQAARKQHVPSLAFASIHLGLGETDQAFQWLEKAVETREGAAVFLNVYPAWEPLRPDPRFAVLVRKMGLPER